MVKKGAGRIVLYCTDVAVQGDRVTCQVRMFISVCDANKGAANYCFRSLSSSFSSSTPVQHHHRRRSRRCHQFGPRPTLWESGFSRAFKFKRGSLVRKAGPGTASIHDEQSLARLRRAAIALIGSTHLVWHALACSQPGLSKRPSYNPYSCPCCPDNRTGNLSLTQCSQTTGCWFRPCTFRSLT